MSELAVPNLGLQLLADLERSGAVTETSLVLPPDTPYDQCDALAAMLGQLHRMNPWLLGDLLNHMERVYGETYAQASATTGLAVPTLMNYTSTCGRVPRSRRRKKISFSVHAEVAWLEPKEQEEWLKRVSQEDWTRERVRLEMEPLRAAKKLAAHLEREGSEPTTVPNLDYQALPRGTDIEILPLAVEKNGHICSCLICGRRHRSDIDVEEE